MSLSTEHLHGREVFFTNTEWVTVMNAFDVFLAILTDDPDLDEQLIAEFKDTFNADEVKALADRITLAKNPASFH